MTLKPAHLICATLLLIMGIANAQPVRKALVEAQISRPDSAKPVYIRGTPACARDVRRCCGLNGH